MAVTFKNAKVCFSSMKNAESKCPYGRLFRILVPMESPELEELRKQYKQLNELAKTQLGEQLGKKLKNAKSVDDVFQESTREGEEGFCVLTFNVVRIRDKEITNEDGTITTKKIFVPDNLYKNGLTCCRINKQTGAKEFFIKGDPDRPILPLSDNTVTVVVELNAKYNSKENKPSIQLKANKVVITDYSEQIGTTNPDYGTIKLDIDKHDDEPVLVSTPATKAEVHQEVADEIFTSDLSALDI